MSQSQKEMQFLLKDPFVIRLLIDAYLTDELQVLSAGGFPQSSEARVLELQALQCMMQTKPLRSRLIGDIGGEEYRLAKKVVKTYELHFKE